MLMIYRTAALCAVLLAFTGPAAPQSRASRNSEPSTAQGQNVTPESCSKLGQAYEYHGDTGTSSCVPHDRTQSEPPETSDVLPNGVRESPAGCLAAAAHTNGPCKVVYPNGNIIDTRTDGTTCLTLKKLDITFQVFSGLPVSGQFQTIISENEDSRGLSI